MRHHEGHSVFLLTLVESERATTTQHVHQRPRSMSQPQLFAPAGSPRIMDAKESHQALRIFWDRFRLTSSQHVTSDQHVHHYTNLYLSLDPTLLLPLLQPQLPLSSFSSLFQPLLHLRLNLCRTLGYIFFSHSDSAQGGTSDPDSSIF